MSKKTRPWNRRQRKAIRRRTRDHSLKNVVWDESVSAEVLAAVFGADFLAEVAKFPRDVTFTVGEASDVGDLFAVRKA